MINWIISKLKLKTNEATDREYLDTIRDLIFHEKVKSMTNYIQHGRIDCLEHSLYVSYSSYLVCRKLGLNYKAAARGGLLHDFFLYDWHGVKPYQGLHGIIHPRISLQNANRYFCLNELEKEIIRRHMWPLTLVPPLRREAYVVCALDKYCAVMETAAFSKRKHVRRIRELLSW